MDDTPGITHMLKEWGEGNQEALDRLMPHVYGELRRRAAGLLRNERTGHTLQATALINEAYLKLVDQSSVNWQNRSHFFAIASQAMRRILVDHARKRHREKRGGAAEYLPIDDAMQIAGPQKHVDMIALDEALNRLATFDPRQVKVVELRYFSGLTNDETAEILGISNATVRSDWSMAKAWLRQELSR
ncbi:MAG TPA: sigma-70 family RNA polymerase sigma factor [Pyrinomonadaceae bacterium]|nr:sigma-70 family RNA polymerase sigma factor [Pyrinomonadaceae bacterium]